MPSATAAQLGTAVSLGLGVATTGSLSGALAHGMAALRVSPHRLQPASLRVDATLSSGVHYNVAAFMANAMVPMGSDTAAAVPYLLLGGGMMTGGGQREAVAGMGIGVIAGRGPVGFFLEARALSSQWPRVLATAGIEF